jgi:hypothetical protein
MSRTITEFVTNFKHGGARANQFEVRLNFPNDAKAADATGSRSRFMVNLLHCLGKQLMKFQ